MTSGRLRPSSSSIPSSGKNVHWGRNQKKIVESFKDHNHANTQTKEEFEQAKLEAKFDATLNSWLRPSRIVLYTLGAMLSLQEIAAMSIPLGFSAWQAVPRYPDHGDCVKDGLHHFTDIDAVLDDAIPHGWQGDAAEAYKEANSTLKNLVQQMVDFDREMEKLVKKHATRVIETQLSLGATQDTLIAAYLVVCFLEVCLSGYVTGSYIALAVSVSAIVAGIISLLSCLLHAESTVDAAGKITYSDITQAANEVGADFAIGSGRPATAASGSNASTSPRGYAPATFAALPGPVVRSGDARQVAKPLAPAVPLATAPAMAASSPTTRLSAGPRPSSNRTNPQDPQTTREEVHPPAALPDTSAGAGAQRSERAPSDDTAPSHPPTPESGATNTANNSCPN